MSSLFGTNVFIYFALPRLPPPLTPTQVVSHLRYQFVSCLIPFCIILLIKIPCDTLASPQIYIICVCVCV